VYGAWSAASEVFDWSEAAQLVTKHNWTVVSVVILVLILGSLITVFRVYSKFEIFYLNR
jgi:uncharacterized membrane protein